MRKPRTSLHDLLLPAFITRENSGARTRPATAKVISSPCLVSSTNPALDPYYLDRHTQHQPDSPNQVFQSACLSGADLADISAHMKRGSHTMLMTPDLHVSTSAIEHRFPNEIGDLKDIPDVESVYRPDPDHSENPLPSTIPRIAFENPSDSDSSASITRTYDFQINVIGASIRQGDFLQLPNRSYVSSSSLHFPLTPRRRIGACDTTTHSDVLFAETRMESGKKTVSDMRQGFIKEGSPYQQQSHLGCASRDDRNILTKAATSNLGGLVGSFCVYHTLEPSTVVHFRGKHRRSKAASYHATIRTLTDRGDLDIQPFPDRNDSRWSPRNGMIVIKVYIPSTDNIWAAYFPTSVTLSAFTHRWVSKLGLHLRFSGSTMDTPGDYFDDDEFQCWVKHRVWRGRNLPIVGHLDYAVLPPL